MKRVRRQAIFDGTLAALAIVSGISVLVARHGGPSKPQGVGTLLLPLDNGLPTSLTLTRDLQSIHIVNRSTTSDTPDWFVEGPWKRAADAATLDAVVTALRDIQLVRMLGGSTDIMADDQKTFGLDRPRYSWQFDINGATWTLSFGADAPSPRGGTYVDVSGPKLPAHQYYVVNADTSKLSLRPEQLLEPRLLRLVPSEIRQLTIESGGSRANLQFDATRARWFEADAQHRRISREKIDKVLFALTNLKGERFLTPASALGKSWADKHTTVTLELDTGRSPIHLSLQGECEAQSNLSLTCVMGPEEICACTNTHDLLVTLEGDVSTWVDRHLFSLRTDEIERLTMRLDGHSLDLERQETGFRSANKDSRVIDVNTGNEALQRLVSIQGTIGGPQQVAAANSFVEEGFLQLRSAVVGSTDAYEERILVGHAMPNGERWVKRVIDSAMLRIDASSAASLLPDDNWLRSKVILKADPSAVQAIEIIHHGKTIRWTLDRTGSMQSQPRVGSPFDASDIERLRACLAMLQVKNWLGGNIDTAKNKFAAQLNFEVSDGDGSPRRYSLDFTINVKRRLIAKLEGSKDCFEPEPELAELLMRVLH